MVLMRQVRGCRGLAILILPTLFWAQGCSRPLALPADGSVPPVDRTSSALADGSKPDDARPEESTNASQSGAQSNLPFKDRENLPAGTMISVRLSNAIAVGDPGASDAFEAVVSQPVVIGVNTLIPSGSTVAGHVESARISRVKPDRGYVRLTLASIHVRGADVPVQTSSLFARQSRSSDGSLGAIRIEKGRDLTFRLSHPLYIATSYAQAGH